MIKSHMFAKTTTVELKTFLMAQMEGSLEIKMTKSSGIA